MTTLYGLVVCGGLSTRMGADKGLLEYYGKPHRYYVYDLLQLYCEKVFIACSAVQAADIPGSYEVITDAPIYQNTGPIAALMSAFELYPGVAFLMLGCDYPFVGKKEIEVLIQSRTPHQLATSYYNSSEDMEDPLLAIYEKEAYPVLKKQHGEKNYSLRFFLRNIQATRVEPSTPVIIASIDTPEAYRQARKSLADH